MFDTPNYLHYNLKVECLSRIKEGKKCGVVQADKLVSKSVFPEYANINKVAIHLFYLVVVPCHVTVM